jgi:sugar lactone lactonase YvrE
MARFSPVEVFHATGARLGEGPCWHPIRQTLWWVDILGQRLFEADLSGKPPRVFSFEQMIAAVSPTREGGLIAALHDGVYLVDPSHGTPVRFATAAAHDPRNFRFNDAKVDPQGRLWAGTLALDGRRGESRLYRVDGDRSVTVMREKVSISNGLAWAPDGRTFYYIDSPTRTVQSFAFDPGAGTLGPPRVAITFAEADGWPDGCCMDAEGGLWIAHWGAAKVTRWDPVTARLLATVELPVRNVTSCAFGGPLRDQLFVTTAFDPDHPTPEPEAGHIFRLDPGVIGLELASFSAA